MKNQEVKRFGYNWLTDFNAVQKFSLGLNVYVCYYYHCMHKKTLIESPLYILDKSLLDEMQIVKSDKFEKPKKERKYTNDEAFKHAIMKLKMRHIFPNTIMDYFYYTDNRKEIPKEFQEKPVIHQNQLTLF